MVSFEAVEQKGTLLKNNESSRFIRSVDLRCYFDTSVYVGPSNETHRCRQRQIQSFTHSDWPCVCRLLHGFPGNQGQKFYNLVASVVGSKVAVADGCQR
jgi:hypothetical protein